MLTQLLLSAGIIGSIISVAVNPGRASYVDQLPVTATPHVAQHNFPTANCLTEPTFELPQLEDYYDGDTAFDIAYDDYLSDFAWAIDEQGLCAELFDAEEEW